MILSISSQKKYNYRRGVAQKDTRQFWVRLRVPPVADKTSKTKRRGQTTSRAPSELVFGYRKRVTKTENKKHIKTKYRGVAQLVARQFWELDAAGSNPVTSTKAKILSRKCRDFCFVLFIFHYSLLSIHYFRRDRIF